jgi:hypothetical protein
MYIFLSLNKFRQFLNFLNLKQISIRLPDAATHAPTPTRILNQYSNPNLPNRKLPGLWVGNKIFPNG